MRVIPTRRMVPELLCTVERGLLGIPSGQLEYTGSHLCARHEEIDRLG
jgi:hypothetical protein